MHICFITSEFPKQGLPHGGVGTFVATLGKKLVENNIKVSVIGLNYIDKNETEINSGLTIYRLKPNKIRGITWLLNSNSVNKKIKEVHKQTPIDLVETAELDLAFLSKIKGIKYVIRMHGGHHFFAKAENRKTEWWKVIQEKRSFRKADAVLAVSEYVAETTRELMGLDRTNIDIIYNPIDSKQFYQCNAEKIRKHSVFFAGTLIEKKGIRQLIQALNYLVDTYPDIHLFIAGRDANLPGTNTPYRPILESQISDKIKSHITFLGVIANRELVNHIESSEICCYPSHMEAMPLAWLEVLAMGKAFIGSKTGPGPEAVSDTVTGLLADPHDPKDIAEKIIWYFENPGKAIEIGKNARKIALQKFDIEVIVKRNMELFEKIIHL